ncbi:AlbA family DNA-binding domain-containing protein (plasmid) [Streptomyces sp. HUAS TT11]|uniref:AlbA family DNA-binding domain-containing protein n=1 Tax=Streptomyces sp. HUAS TT11 TaxID=3447508 RepID=UPI003F65519C
MNARSIDLDTLRRDLGTSEQDAYVRAMAVRADTGWGLHHCWALIGAEPPQWSETLWQYQDHAFVACRVPAAVLAVLCSPEAGSALALGPLTVSVPAATGPAYKNRHPSYARHERAPLPVPAVDVTIAPADRGSRNVTQTILVGEGVPSFPEPNSAWRAFFEGDYSLIGAQGPPDDLARLRFAEGGAWLGRVHVTPTQLVVAVEGSSANGAELELFGESERSSRRLEAPGEVTFPLAHGLPAHAWLWLKRDTTWLDYRSIDPGSGWTGDLDRAGVEIEMPVEPQAHIEALIASGEGPCVEFKECLPTKQSRRTLKTVVAFANGDGGTMVFGINRDEVTVTGVTEDNPPTKLRDHLVDLVRGTVIPMPHVEARDYRIDDKLILVLEVSPGMHPPYGLSTPDTRDKPEYFVRRGASTFPAQPNDLNEAVLSRRHIEGDTSSGFTRFRPARTGA